MSCIVLDILQLLNAFNSSFQEEETKADRGSATHQ